MLRSTLAVVPADTVENSSACLPWALCVCPLEGPLYSQDSEHPNSQSSERLTDGEDRSTSALRGLHGADIPRCSNCAAYLSASSDVRESSWRCFLCGSVNVQEHVESHVALFTHDGIYRNSTSEMTYMLEETAVGRALYVFVVQESTNEIYANQIAESIRAALACVEEEAGVCLLTVSDASVSVLDITTRSLNRLATCDWHAFELHERVTKETCSKWVVSLNSEEAMTVIPDMVRNVRCVNEQISTRGRSDPAYASLLAVRLAIDICSVEGMSVSRVFVFVLEIDSVWTSDEDSHALGMTMDSAISSDEVRDAYVSSVLKWFDTGGDDEVLEEGLRAARIGAVVDIFGCSITGGSISCTPTHRLAAIPHRSGGQFSSHVVRDSSLLPAVVSRVQCPVGVCGFLRVRTSPEVAVQEAYGQTIERDPDVGGLFCFVAGQGKASSFTFDLQHSMLEGFGGTYRRPGSQVAFQCTVLEPCVRPRRVLAVTSRKFGVSHAPLSVEASLDASTLAVLVFHRALTISIETGVQQARSFLLDWITERVRSFSEVGPFSNRATDMTSPRAVARLVNQLLSPSCRIRTSLLITCGLLRTPICTAEMPAAGLLSGVSRICALGPEPLHDYLVSCATYEIASPHNQTIFRQFVDEIVERAMSRG